MGAGTVRDEAGLLFVAPGAVAAEGSFAFVWLAFVSCASVFGFKSF
jgi:hypothetical protein